MNFLDIRILRAVAILSIVVGHSLAIHTSAWSFIYKIEPFIPFKILGYLISSYFLWLFVMISGFLFGYQLENKKKNSFKINIKKKFQRLLIPYFFWGLLYFFTFNDSSDFSLAELVFQLSSGIGHLWFLLMLFWVFLFSYLLQSLKLSNHNLIIVILITFIVGIGMLSNNWNFLQIGNSFKYLTGFYFGYFLYRKQITLMGFKNSRILKFILLFLFLFFFKYLGEYLMRYSMNISNSLILELYKEITGLPTGLLGSFIIYIYVKKNVDELKTTTKKALLKIEKNSFGIYIFHQFFMFLLLMHITHSISSILLSIVLIILGLIGSFGSIFLFKRTTFLRKFI